MSDTVLQVEWSDSLSSSLSPLLDARLQADLIDIDEATRNDFKDFILVLLSSNPGRSSFQNELIDLGFPSDKFDEFVTFLQHSTTQLTLPAANQHATQKKRARDPVSDESTTTAATPATTTAKQPKTAASSTPSSTATSSATSNTDAMTKEKKIIKLNSGNKLPADAPLPSKSKKFETANTTVKLANKARTNQAIPSSSNDPVLQQRLARFGTTSSTGTAVANADGAANPSVPVVTKSIRLKPAGEVLRTYEDEDREREVLQRKQKELIEKQRQAYEAEQLELARKKTIRCIHWPQCTNTMCPYHHPTQMCSFFPACSKGDACMYIHPSIPCKFGVMCKNPACSYTHPAGFRKPKTPMHAPAAPAASSSVIPCKFGKACLRSDCVFTHPADRVLSGGSSSGASPTIDANKIRAAMAKVPCRYDALGCKNPACMFAHFKTVKQAPTAAATPAATLNQTDANNHASEQQPETPSGAAQ